MKKTQGQVFDGLLVVQHLGGNKNAMALLWKRWSTKMRIHAYRFTKNQEVAKDIAQDSWMVIINKLNQLKEPSLFGVWALSIVSRKAIDWVRKQQNKHRFEKEIKQQSIATDSNDLKDAQLILVQNEMQKLSNKQKIVLQLFYLESYNLSEISSILSISIGTVKSRLFNAREQLKKCITKNNNHEK